MPSSGRTGTLGHGSVVGIYLTTDTSPGLFGVSRPRAYSR
jgi:hypothetical protein